MNELVLYLVKASVINAVLLALCYFTLRKSNKFSHMRLILLLAMILPLLLPLLPLGDSVISVFKIKDQNALNSISIITLPALNVEATSNLSWHTIVLIFYYTIATVFISGVLLSIISIYRKRKQSIKHSTIYGEVLLQKDVSSPFSFFNWVFISHRYLTHPGLDSLLRHEFYHVKEKHSFDRLIIGVFRSVLWFNPLAHLTAYRLIEVHEFQADAYVIKGNINSTDYSDLMLSFYFQNIPIPGLSNNFSFHVKKRIAMINNLKTGQIKTGRIILGISIALIAVLSTSMLRSEAPHKDLKSPNSKKTVDLITSTETNINTSLLNAQIPQKDPSSKKKEDQVNQKKQKMVSEDETMIFTVVEDPPKFPGGDDARAKYMASKVVYPDEARKKGIQGTVYLTFIVQADGSVTDLKVLRGAHELLDKAALEAASGMPKWEPGRQKGKPVAVQFNMPVKFALEKDSKKSDVKKDSDEDIKADKK